MKSLRRSLSCLAITAGIARAFRLFGGTSVREISRTRTRHLNMAFQMDYTYLGDSDLLVSKVCLGTMTFGQQNTLEEGVEQLNVAFDEYGINFLDTAEMYPVPTKPDTQGDTDRILSQWLKGRDRSKVILASKVAGASPRLTWLPGRDGRGSRVSKEDILVSVDESLKRLGTDYIDLIQIHWPDRYVPIFGASNYDLSQEKDYISFEEQLSAFEILNKQGKVRYVGVSNETPYGVMKFCQIAEQRNLPKIVSIQNSYSLIVRSDFECSLTEVCSPRHENVGLLAYSPLAGGILTGKYLREDCPSTARLNLFEGYMDRYKQSMAQEAVAEYVKIAAKHDMTPTELALIWCYSQPHVASTIIGATNVLQLRENIGAWTKKDRLTTAVLQDIDHIYRRYRDPSRI